jgi:hypothetical protein
MMRSAPILALLFLLAGNTPAAAQGGELLRALERVTQAWARGDADALAAQAARSGLSLEVDGRQVGPLGSRQAAAALRRVFDERETVGLRPGQADIAVGSPQRAFVELAWFTRARGTTIPERATVFVALVREDGGWRVTEIRLLP